MALTIMSITLDYYNQNASTFYAETINANLARQYQLFEKYLQPKAHILDLGCGSGRDSKYFQDQGYTVTAIDGSRELCKLARELTGLDVKEMLFQDLAYSHEFDGIWASASLLHLPKDELLTILEKIAQALKEQGILYASFKYGRYCGVRQGRYFTDLDLSALSQLINQVPTLTILEHEISADVRPKRSKEQWLNVVMRRA